MFLVDFESFALIAILTTTNLNIQEENASSQVLDQLGLVA